MLSKKDITYNININKSEMDEIGAVLKKKKESTNSNEKDKQFFLLFFFVWSSPSPLILSNRDELMDAGRLIDPLITLQLLRTGRGCTSLSVCQMLNAKCFY